ncbi:DNA_binding HTH domain [Hexamita inflata]|uniref:Psq-type n=1 Tax=Hexamita inflata TaxID=28002 RepID=A0AA86TP66_9EUKA|nr:DNA binding HTH domain [Hexamita inflata]CAI9969061.1 DNA binding HTH domain [Hexamita inflata]CAI9969064.1 DNA binding HTH domain [Hexamita inflata]CAI9969067.1 DNA binding HTH domain [Hexamita inflata]
MSLQLQKYTETSLVDKQLIQKAIEYMLVYNLSVRQCAQLFKIPKSTLHRNFQKRKLQDDENQYKLLIDQLTTLL